MRPTQATSGCVRAPGPTLPRTFGDSRRTRASSPDRDPRHPGGVEVVDFPHGSPGPCARHGEPMCGQPRRHVFARAPPVGAEEVVARDGQVPDAATPSAPSRGTASRSAPSMFIFSQSIRSMPPALAQLVEGQRGHFDASGLEHVGRDPAVGVRHGDDAGAVCDGCLHGLDLGPVVDLGQRRPGAGTASALPRPRRRGQSGRPWGPGRRSRRRVQPRCRRRRHRAAAGNAATSRSSISCMPPSVAQAWALRHQSNVHDVALRPA